MMKYVEIVRINVGFDFKVHSHDSWEIGQDFWGNLDGDTFKICRRMFMSGCPSCRGIG